MTQDRTSHLLTWVSRFISDTESCNWNSEKPQKASTSPLYRSTREESGKFIHTGTPTHPDPRVISQGEFPSPSQPAVLRGSLDICHLNGNDGKSLLIGFPLSSLAHLHTQSCLQDDRGTSGRGKEHNFFSTQICSSVTEICPIPCSHHVSPVTWHGPHTSPRLTFCVASRLYNPNRYWSYHRILQRRFLWESNFQCSKPTESIKVRTLIESTYKKSL